MKILRNTIIILASLLILLLIANKICLRYPGYVLFRNGVSRSDILLEMKKNTYYNSYLYKGKDNSIGYIVLGKKNSDDSNFIVKQNETLSMNDPYSFIYSNYPYVFKDGNPNSNCVLAGYVDIEKIKNPQFLIEGTNLVTPTLSKTSDDGTKVFFIHDTGYALQGKTSDMLKIRSSDTK